MRKKPARSFWHELFLAIRNLAVDFPNKLHLNFGQQREKETQLRDGCVTEKVSFLSNRAQNACSCNRFAEAHELGRRRAPASRWARACKV